MYMQILSQNLHTSRNVHKEKRFWSFPHRVLNKLTLGLPYALIMLKIDPPLPIGGIYLEPLGCIEVGEFGERH